MDLELKTYIFFTRKFPGIRGFGRLKNLIKKFYNRKKREKVIFEVFNFKMELDPSEHVDGEILFLPIYEKLFTDFIRKNLKPGDVFVDVGANVGFYSLLARSMGAKVLAVEADPENFKRLMKNIELNDFKDIVALNIGVSDKQEVLKLGRNDVNNNMGMNTFMQNDFCKDYVEVECKSLMQILNENNIEKVDFMKIDIEGFERKVLSKFFSENGFSLLPTNLLIEDSSSYYDSNIGLYDMISNEGYVVENNQNVNYIFKYGK